MRFRRTKRGGWPYSHPPNTQFTLNRDSPQSEGLVGWWPTLDQNGNAVRDYSGRGNAGVLVGAPGWARDGEYGEVLEFNGTSDYVDIALPDAFLTPPCTVTARFLVTVLPSVAGDEYTLFRYATPNNNSSRYQIRIDDDNDYIEATVGGGGGFDYATAIVVNTWYTVALVSRGSNDHQVYVNGDPGGTGVDSFPTITTNELRIGVNYYDGNRDWHDGLITDVRAYNVGKAQTELYNIFAPQTRWELYAPIKRWWAGWTVGAAPGNAIPMAAHHYRMRRTA